MHLRTIFKHVQNNYIVTVMITVTITNLDNIIARVVIICNNISST